MSKRPRQPRGRIRKNPNRLSQVAIKSVEEKIDQIRAEREKREGIDTQPARPVESNHEHL